MPASDVTIYHNPRCATSRKTLELLRKRGVEPRIVEYLKTPPDAAELQRLLKMLGLAPRQLLRKKEAKEAGLDRPGLSDAQIIAGLAKHPIAIERPIVVKGTRAALGRPPEAALKVL
ncbi:MAG TPA: arsenate reductase (glutaredoxin) [Stellaceae bacterium]|nr:arsenate reductase (glutaredoxin) [Stellaceae bacterium]